MKLEAPLLLSKRRTGLGPLVSFDVRFRTRRSARQRRVRAGRSASLRRSVLRTDSPAMLGLVACRRTHYVRCAYCVQTAATSQLTKRAARAATSPALLGASEALRVLPTRTFADTVLAFDRHATVGDLRGRRYPAGAISAATRSAGPGSARAQRVLRELTHRSCLSAVSEANAASSAMRPRTEHRSGVGAKRRPPQHEPLPGTACRDALKPCESSRPRTTGSGRKRTLAARQRFKRRGPREAPWGH